MKIDVNFILSKAYNFKDEKGNQVEGVSCKCYDPSQNAIISVKTDKVLPYTFGQKISVDCVINGRYVNYQHKS